MPIVAIAESRAELLGHCLATFDGIALKLPYMPPMSVRHCASPSVSFQLENTSIGRRSVEFIGELTLGPGPTASSDEGYANLQDVVFAHFEKLIARRGYRRTAQEQGNARYEVDAYSQCMLHGGRCREEDFPVKPPLPPIPFVNKARFERDAAGAPVVLTYEVTSKNTWRLTIEGAPVEMVSNGVPR